MKEFKIIKVWSSLLLLLLMLCSKGFAKGDVMENKSLYDDITKSAEHNNWSRIYVDSKINADEYLHMDYRSKRKHVVFRNLKAQLSEPRIAISPNGRFGAFWINEDYETYSLELVDLATREIKRIATLKKGCCIAWSPDSTQIAFLSIDKDSEIPEHILNVINIKSFNINKLLTGSIDFLTEQAWSYDGNKIAYSYGNKIFTYEFKSNIATPLIDGSWASWSPGNSTILYFDSQKNSLNLLEMDKVNYRSKTLLSPEELGEGVLTFPFYWFPDGKYVFVGHLSPQETEIGLPYVFNVETHKAEKLSDYSWYFSSWGFAK